MAPDIKQHDYPRINTPMTTNVLHIKVRTSPKKDSVSHTELLNYKSTSGIITSHILDSSGTSIVSH